MFERFSEPARQAFVVAHEEARALGSARLGTEHVLLGVLHDDGCIAAQAFGSLGITSREMRRRIVLASPSAAASPVTLEFSGAAKRVLELSVREALRRAGARIGTGDVALGLIGVRDGLAARLLEELGVDRDTGRARVREAMAAGPEPAPARSRSSAARPTPQLTPEARQMLRTVARLGSSFAVGRFVPPNVMRAASVTSRIARQLGPLTPDGRLAPAVCSLCGVASPACGALYASPLGALVCENCAGDSGADGGP